MDDSGIDELALRLSDLEIAILLCLVAREHCLVETTEDSIDDVAKELALIASRTFGLSYAIASCSSATTFHEFSNEILGADTLGNHGRSSSWMTSGRSSIASREEFKDHKGPSTAKHALGHEIAANVIIAKGFNHASEHIQLQTLQLLRSKQLITPNAVLNSPTGSFLFIPLVARDYEQLRPPLNGHLNDHLFISHFHDPKLGYAHLEDVDDWFSDGQESISSVVRKPETQNPKKHVYISEKTLEKLHQSIKTVTSNADVIRYQHDIVVFLRLSRAVAGGVSVKANNHLSRFARLLALLNGTDYLIPSIISLAAKKVFRHRIVVARPEDDRSLEYGSDLDTVAQVLSNVSPEMILANIISEVDAPL